MTSRRLKDLLSRTRQTVATTNATPRHPPPRRATNNATTPQTATETPNEIIDLKLSRVAPPRKRDNATNDVAAPPSSPGLPPLPPAAEARRQKVLAMLARDGTRYAVYVDDPNTDPVIMALATPDGTCDVLIPRDRYDPFEVLAVVKEWEREPPPLWWRVAITKPARTVEVDTPSGYTLPDWQAYTECYHGPGCTVTPIAGLPKPRSPVDLDEALRAACDGMAGITPEVFRSLLSPEDLDDIAAGAIHRKTLKAYAQSFAEGLAQEVNR